jgi:hypothetical protein
MTKKPAPEDFRGQLMLQIANGRFFRPGVPINEHTHRRTAYSNVWFLDPRPEQLPVGSVLGSTDLGPVSTAMLEAVDRLEAQRPDGTDDIMIATGGDELIDDIAYVLTFVLNRTFARDHDLVLRLVSGAGRGGRRRDAAGLFPGLFDKQQVLRPADLDVVRQFMEELLALDRGDFARVMRVVRRTVDATRRAAPSTTRPARIPTSSRRWSRWAMTSSARRRRGSGTTAGSGRSLRPHCGTRTSSSPRA